MNNFEWSLPTRIVYGPGQLRRQRWAKLARRVFGVTEKDDLKAAKELSKAVVAWLKKIGMCIKFSDVGIGSEKFERMTDDIIRMYAQEDGKVPGSRPMDRKDLLEIFRRSH